MGGFNRLPGYHLWLGRCILLWCVIVRTTVRLFKISFGISADCWDFGSSLLFWVWELQCYHCWVLMRRFRVVGLLWWTTVLVDVPRYRLCCIAPFCLRALLIRSGLRLDAIECCCFNEQNREINFFLIGSRYKWKFNQHIYFPSAIWCGLTSTLYYYWELYMV